MLVQRAIETAAGQVEQLAADTGVSKHTLYAWAAERRRPSAENLRRFAAILRARGEGLQDLADQLEQAAGDE